jgi:acetyl esterase/lipase
MKIIIGGDSAGGGLAAVLMAHLCHPHPLIPAIQLKCPIKGAILVSPWVTFDQKSGSMKENEQMDILSKRFLQHASVAFLSNAAVTVYNTPKSGDTVFWSDLREKIANVRVIAGGLELFVDDVQEFVDTIKVSPDVSSLNLLETRCFLLLTMLVDYNA